MALTDLSRKERTAVSEKIDAMLAEGMTSCPEIHRRWEENSSYTRGEQWKKGDIARQKRRQRPVTTLNDVFKVVHAIANKEMVERFVPKVIGRSGEDHGIANVVDEACRWQRQYSGSEHYESMAFRSAVMCGYGVAHKYWDPSDNDGAGAIKDEDVPLCEMLWPQRARDMNLLDRRWHMRGKWVDVEEAESLWGSVSPALRKKFKKYRRDRTLRDADIGDTGGASKDDEITGYGRGRGNMGSSGGFGWQGVRAGTWLNNAKDEVFVIETEWKELEYVWRAAIPTRFYEWYNFVAFDQPMIFPQPPTQDPNTGEMVGSEPFVLTRDAWKALSVEEQEAAKREVMSETEEVVLDSRKLLNEFLDQWNAVMGTEFQSYVESARTTIRYAIKVDDELVDYGVRPWGWSYHFITGFPFETADGNSFHGVVDIIKGAQDYKNALVSNLLAVYMTSPKGTFVFGKSVGNINDIADKLAQPGSVLQLPDQVLQNWDGMVKQFPQPNYPSIGDNLLAIFTDGVLGGVGLNSVALGAQSDLRRVSGTVVQAAQTSSNVIVAIPFDAMRLFRKQYGLCNIRFLHRMYDLEDIIRIVGAEKAEDVQNIDPTRWGEIVRYDVIVDESPSTPSEQMEQVQALTATGTINEFYARGDLSFPAFVKHFMPALPESAKRDILKDKQMMDLLTQAQQENAQLQQQLQSLTAQAQQGMTANAAAGITEQAAAPQPPQ